MIRKITLIGRICGSLLLCMVSALGYSQSPVQAAGGPVVGNLTAALVATPNTGVAPFTPVLTATAGGSATGTLNFTFYCNQSDTSTTIVAGYSERAVGTNTNPFASTSCTYSIPGTYTAKVIIERGAAVPAQAQAVVTVTAPPTLIAGLSANNTSGLTPFNPTLTGTASGTATGTMNFTFYCNRADTGTNITAGYDYKLDGTSTNPLNTTACIYNTAGTYTAKVIIERSTAPAAQAQLTITVSDPTLTAGLSADTTTGLAPFTPVLTATAGGTATGVMNFTFYCDRADTGTNITLGYSEQALATSTNPKTSSSCVYSTAGTYTAKVIIERGTAPPAQAQVFFSVTEPPPPVTSSSTSSTTSTGSTTSSTSGTVSGTSSTQSGYGSIPDDPYTTFCGGL